MSHSQPIVPAPATITAASGARLRHATVVAEVSAQTMPAAARPEAGELATHRPKTTADTAPATTPSTSDGQPPLALRAGCATSPARSTRPAYAVSPVWTSSQKNDLLIVAEATGGSLLRPATAGTTAAHADSMTANRFRAVAWVLIGFNILGTILTWAAHLQKPGTGAATAIAGGTQVTGPLLLVAVAIVAVAVTYSARRWLARTGIVLLALFGAGFAFGEITELFQHNIGISAGRWDVVIAASVIGAIIGITEAFLAVKTLLTSRQADRLAATSTT